MAQVDAKLRTGGSHLLTVEVIPVGGEQMHIGAQQGQVVGDVPAHAPQADGDGAGIGVRCHQGRKRAPADVHVDAAHHHGIAAAAQHIAPAGNAALFGQIGNVHRNAGTGDAHFLSDFLLGNQGIGFNQLQNLPFPLCHGRPPERIK